MFPRLPCKVTIHGPPLMVFDVWVEGGQPCIDHETGTRVKPIWLSRSIGRVKSIEKRRGGDLS